MSKTLTLKTVDKIISSSKMDKVKIPIVIDEEEIIIEFKTSVSYSDFSAMVNFVVEHSLQVVEHEDIFLFNCLIETLSNIPSLKIKDGDNLYMDLDKVYKLYYSSKIMDRIDGMFASEHQNEYELFNLVNNLRNAISKKLNLLEQKNIYENKTLERFENILKTIESFIFNFTNKSSIFIDNLQNIEQSDIEYVLNGVKDAILSGKLDTKNVVELVEKNFINKKIENLYDV